jgi:hypothetical protein
LDATKSVLQLLPAKSTLPERYYVGFPNSGLFGLDAGDRVCVFDELSLSNPIGSHFILTKRTRPGHEKVVPLDWMDARFGFPMKTAPAPSVSVEEISAARAALSCGPLAGYLGSIFGPLTLDRVLENFVHSIEWTTMSFSSNPSEAKRQLCD